jgi:hypothetical protein
MTERQLEDYLIFNHEVRWISYFIVPIILIVRIAFTWFCLKAGSFLVDRFKEVSFWNICIQAEVVFVVGAFAILLYNEFFGDIQTIEQLSTNPFSLNVLAGESFPIWGKYFLNILNAFEIVYVVFLAYLIALESNKTFSLSLKFVATTYLPGLALWIILVTYISVVFLP